MSVACLPCIQQSHSLGATAPTAQAHDVMRDVVSAGVAFAATALYVKKAPKKWKRPGKVGAVAAVVGLYFLTSFAYGKLYT